MKLDRIFIELHDGDDLVLIDVDQIHAIAGETNSTVYFAEFPNGFVVDESPKDVVALIHEAYVKASTARVGGKLMHEKPVSDFDRALGYPRPPGR